MARYDQRQASSCLGCLAAVLIVLGIDAVILYVVVEFVRWLFGW